MSGMQTNILFERDARSESTYVRSGQILRGYGPPLPVYGRPGQCYIDTAEWGFYVKRSVLGTDPWGYPLFTVPSVYRTNLNWFGAAAPGNDLGSFGDYYVRWHDPNCGIAPIIYGPKLANNWPESAEGPEVPVSTVDLTPIGLLDEGAPVSPPGTSLSFVGLLDEAADVAVVTLTPATQIGLEAGGLLLPVTINPLYPAEAGHAI